MAPEGGLSSLAIDLARVHGRTVTSFYSNLVTRPTGRAIRMGVETQIAELQPRRRVCLSVLDFSQVRVIDYSCADEIVAKLLLRYAERDRPAEAYFLIRGLQDHHAEAVQAVLERHGLLAVAQETAGAAPQLMGPSDPFQRACWNALARRGRATVADVAADAELGPDVVEPTLRALLDKRVAVMLSSGQACELSCLAREVSDAG